MDWFKVESDIATNPKVDDLSDGAYRAMTYLWAHAMRHENGGKVPANAARLIPRVTKRRLEELAAAGFLHPNGSGYVIHDWEDHQAEALSHQDKRRKDLERLKEHRQSEAERLREYRRRKSEEEA